MEAGLAHLGREAELRGLRRLGLHFRGRVRRRGRLLAEGQQREVAQLPARKVGGGLVERGHLRRVVVGLAQRVEEEVVVQPLVGDGAHHRAERLRVGHERGVRGDTADAGDDGRLVLRGAHRGLQLLHAQRRDVGLEQARLHVGNAVPRRNDDEPGHSGDPEGDRREERPQRAPVSLKTLVAHDVRDGLADGQLDQVREGVSFAAERPQLRLKLVGEGVRFGAALR